MLRIFRVTGDSLSPEYQEGDYVVLATIPFFIHPIKVGDVIVFDIQPYGTLIKRVESVEGDNGLLTVKGDRVDSVDSRNFGPIHKKSVIGKVVWHIRKPGRER